MSDELSEHLNALQRDDCYRVISVLKSSPQEITELVVFKGINGSETGPFIRKRIQRNMGTGSAYETLYHAQQQGKRFLHLPYIYDCYNAGEQTVVIMEYLKGETLHEVIYRCDPSLALAIDIFPRLCDAVLELHEAFDAPIIHRDIKPTNIILSQGSLGIIDFGIARLYKEGSSEDTHHFGTKEYAPPEQFGFGQTDVRSDVYALGMVLWFCLTEETPTAQARLNGFMHAGVPQALRQVIVRATALDPKDRYASVRALKQAFLEAVTDVSLHGTDLQVASLRYPKNAVKALVTPASSESILSRLRYAFKTTNPLGILSGCIMIFLMVVFLAASVHVAIYPDPDLTLAHAPLYLRLLNYGCIYLFIFFPIFTLGIPKQLIAVVIPKFASVKISRRILYVALSIIISFVLVGILSFLR